MSSSRAPQVQSPTFGKAPMFVAAAAFAAGIALAKLIWHPPLLWTAALLLLCAGSAVLLRLRPWLSAVTIALAFIACGAFVSGAQQSVQKPTREILKHVDKGEVTLVAHVIRDGVWRDGAFGGKQQSVDVEVEQVLTADGISHALSGGVRLNIYPRAHRSWESDDDDEQGQAATELPPNYVYGQRLKLTAKLRPPMNYGNPGAMDYRGYVASQGMDALGSAPANTVEILPEFAGSRWGDLRARLRRNIVLHIHRVWPEREAGLLDAMLIGERAYLTREWREAFQRSGTYHILVVSGMNVGILAFVVFWFLRKVRASNLLATIVTLLLAFGYTVVTDAGAPIMRATLMLAIYLFTRLLYRERAPLNAVGVAALGLLICDPHALYEASFQLTFLSVAALAGIAVPLLERTSGPYSESLRLLWTVGYDQALAPKQVQFRLDLRMIADRVGRLLGKRAARFVVARTLGGVFAVYEVLVVSALMQVALALPMVWYFHRASLFALPANSLVVPLTGVLMPAAVLAVALSYVASPLAWPAKVVTSWSLGAICGTVKLLGTMRISDVRVPVPDWRLAILASIAFVVAMLLARRRAAFCAVGVAGLIVTAFWMTAAPPAPKFQLGKFELVAIDVGQGDSLLLITPEGKALLLDSGGMLGNGHSEFDVGEEVVSPYLWSRGISRLDAVAFSHGHADHMGGMAAVIRNFRPRELWMSEFQVPTHDLEKVLAAAEESHVQVVKHAAGDAFDFGGLHFAILSPPRDWDLKDRVRDDDAMVLRVSYKENSVLMVGDVGKKIERELIAEHVHADLLKVGHHGSVTSTSPEFLAEVKPRYGIISVGARNSFRHPRPEVLARLQEAHVATYRTDLLGAVSFLLDGKSIQVAPIPK